MDDERLYEIAGKELEARAPRKGLFARAFSEAMGEDAKAKAIYIRLRVEQLRAQLKSREAEEQHGPAATVRHKLEQQPRPIASDSGAGACIAALEECGFVVKKISADGWEITGLGQSSSVHAYGEARLRELTSELAWEKWVIGRAPDGAGSPRNAQTGNPQVMLPDRQAAGHQSADQGGTAEEPDREAAAPEPEEGFLSRLIGGDLGLAKTYWVYSVLGGVVASLFSRSITSPAALAWFVLILAVYQVLVSIGIWNAAGKYTGWAIWAVLARIAVVIGAVLLLVVVAGTLATMDGSSRGADSQPAHPPSSGTVNGQEYKGVFERCMTYPPNVNSFSASELKSYCHSLAKTWATAR